MLDTNICIYIMQRQPASVAKRFSECRQGDVVISAITLAELEYGVHCSAEKSRAQNRRALDSLLKIIPAIPFTPSAAQAYAAIRAAALEQKRGALDKLIASHAKSMNIILVTNNLNDFEIYPDTSLENWVEDSSSLGS